MSRIGGKRGLEPAVHISNPEGQQPIVGWLLGAAGLVMVALGFVLFGYTAPAVVAGVAALAMAGYAIKSRFAATQTSSISS